MRDEKTPLEEGRARQLERVAQPGPDAVAMDIAGSLGHP